MTLLQILANVALAAGLGAALLAIGARVRTVLRLPATPLLRLPVDLSLGAWIMALLLLALGLVGWLRPLALVAAVACLAAPGCWWGVRRPWTAVAPAALAGLLSLPIALSPPFFYDALVYHLGLPWQALREGALRAHPESVFSAFPPLAQLLALPPLALGLERVPALLHWCSWLAAAAALGSLARRLGASRPRGLAAASLLMVLPASPLVPGLPAAEGWLLAPLLASLRLALQPRRPGAALTSGLLAGIAVSARLQGLPWAALVLLLLLAEGPARLRHLARASLGLVVGASPWWLKNLLLLHDPAAPLLWRREGLETLWRDGGALALRGLPLAEIPGHLVAALAPQLPVLAPLGLAAVLALRRRDGRVLALACGVGLATWAAGGALPRFLAPSLALMVALTASVAGSRLARGAAALALAATALSGLGQGSGLLLHLDPPRLIALPPGSSLPTVVNDPGPAFVRARVLSADARVLFVGEPRGHGFPRRFVAPSQHDLPILRGLLEASADPAAVCGGLRDLGFTHLLVNHRELARLSGGYPVTPWASAQGRHRWGRLLALLAPPVVEADGVEVLELSRGSPPSPP